jgi:hypothetical protein
VLNGRSDAGVSKYNEIAKIKWDYSKHRLKKVVVIEGVTK